MDDHARLVRVPYCRGVILEVVLIDNLNDDLGYLSRKRLHNGLLNISYSYNAKVSDDLVWW